MSDRRAYNLQYYQRTKARRVRLASHRAQRVIWCAWLLANLEWPAEPVLVVPVALPIRRPVLRLKR